MVVSQPGFGGQHGPDYPQFEMMELFYCRNITEKPGIVQQLELF